MGSGARSETVGERVTAVSIRPARAADVLSVGLIERDSFADPWGSREFTTALEAAQTIFLVAEDEDGVIVGYSIALVVADESEILNIAVETAHRGNGVGGLLLDAAVSEVRKRGAEQVFLEVRESNVAARKLYGSRGFDEISRRRGYYKMPVEDALVLRMAMQ
jgi:[ribosomal protein S18]-alanine N-acetyltransferase